MKDYITPFSLIRAMAKIDNPAQIQLLVPVRAKHHGLVVIQSEPKLSDKQKLICTNGVVQVSPDKIFQLLMASFANPNGSKSNKSSGHISTDRLTSRMKRIRTAWVALGIVNEPPITGRENIEAIWLPQPLSLTTSEEKTKDSLNTPKLHQSPANDNRRFPRWCLNIVPCGMDRWWRSILCSIALTPIQELNHVRNGHTCWTHSKRDDPEESGRLLATCGYWTPLEQVKFCCRASSEAMDRGTLKLIIVGSSQSRLRIHTWSKEWNIL